MPDTAFPPTADSDTKEEDFYGHRLAAVNTTNPVIANENILNSQGVLLVAKGSEISHSKADLIAKHKLIKPLEHSVDVSQSIDATVLMETFKQYCETHPGLNAALEEDEWTKLATLCTYYEKYSLVRQKLTVLSSQLPNIYYDSLYSAVAGVAIGMKLNLDGEDLRAVFIGGLMHNTGYLHLNPEIAYDEMQTEQALSREMQAHPVIAKHFLDHIPGLSKKVGKAVVEHHERTDGTGYPKGMFGADLSVPGQVIGMTNTIIKNFKVCQDWGEHAHQLILLTLQLNDNIHFEEVYRASAKLLRKGPMPTHPPDNVPDPIDVLHQEKCLLETFESAKKLAFVLMKNTRNRHTKSIASMIGRLATSIVSSGMMQEEYITWLGSLTENNKPEDHLNLLKSHVMTREIFRQLHKLKTIMWKTIELIPDEETSLKEDCTETFKLIEQQQKACDINV